ncbi:MAG: hypothetical protein O4861_09000 [Trichodesmium sp. St16_bin4-tuft]|nr:hypothetical protein [Trichodesmium sp. MAG_R01]MDE5072914.1 hypothetical protein [Trichodesmium sp. St5_bin8]MDE5098462.1 hypothetical protein [Trichodesmium sp. St16_bin4-tuft]MDE5102688.1 hypothetical protein [Trichodesmium sp. St19_bin2]MDT9341567.1 hypothetical protein [Trichodesmium erythraeum 21-75]
MLEFLASVIITQGILDWEPVGYNTKATTLINMNTIEGLGNNLWRAEVLKQYDQEADDGMKQVYMVVEIDCNIGRFASQLIRRQTGLGEIIAETTLEGNRFISPQGSEAGILMICDR